MIAQYEGLSLVSRVIRWRTRSTVSHTAWIRRDGRVCEAWTKDGVRITANLSARHTPGTPVRVYRLKDFTDEQWDAMDKWTEAQCGKPYDYRSVWRFMTLKPATENGKWFCSELVTHGLRSIGYPILNGEPHLLSPRDVGLSPLLIWDRDRRTYAGE